eukprot:m.79551 g.79551  ORF g.79551 m.79551 type:complete len:146 (+) comp25226_c0_seq1:216-653(+)
MADASTTPSSGLVTMEMLSNPDAVLPKGARRMIESERKSHLNNVIMALARQGMMRTALPQEQQDQMDKFVNNGDSFELNIKTAKGFVYCKLANITAEAAPAMIPLAKHVEGALVAEDSINNQSKTVEESAKEPEGTTPPASDSAK